jgi:hypothetical protein
MLQIVTKRRVAKSGCAATNGEARGPSSICMAQMRPAAAAANNLASERICIRAPILLAVGSAGAYRGRPVWADGEGATCTKATTSTGAVGSPGRAAARLRGLKRCRAPGAEPKPVATAAAAR